MSVMVEFLKRHGSHHKINIKYGYILFIFSLLTYIITIHFLPKFHLFKTTRFKNFIIFAILCLSCIILQNHHLLLENFSSSVYVKRLGRLAVALMPLNFIISLKHPSSTINNTKTIGKIVDYLGLMWLHKWLSRMIVVLGTFHSIGFMVIFLKRGELWKIFKVWNFMGLIAWLLFILIGFISLRGIRRKIYTWFYSIHVVFGYVVLLFLQLHARPGITFFTGVNLGVIGYAFVVKYMFSYTIIPSGFQIIEETNSDLIVIVIGHYPFSTDVDVAGGHLRVSTLSPKNPLFYLTSSHPYTMIKQDNTLKLVVRKKNFNIPSNKSLTIFGPFQSPVLSEVTDTSNMILIAGGSGISFTLSLYQKYRAQRAVNKIKFCWIIRDIEDLWILKEFGYSQGFESDDNVQIEIFVTKKKDKSTSFASKKNKEMPLSIKEEQQVGLMLDIELEDLASPSQLTINDTQPQNPNILIKFRKPSIPKLLADFFDIKPNSKNFHDNHEMVGIRQSGNEDLNKLHGSIFCCGPSAMVQECEEVLKRDSYDGRNIRCFGEIYEM